MRQIDQALSQDLSRLMSAYREHPLSYQQLVKRLNKQKKLHVRDATEIDLAFDDLTQITDQNHIGGAYSTLRLASAATITARDSVVDLGCGIGGPCRLLSAVLGCKTHGIDTNREHIRDAIRLTKATRLEKTVSFEVGDIRRINSRKRFSVVWGQNAWLHVPESGVMAHAAASLLKPHGRLAFEEVCQRRSKVGRGEIRQLSKLQNLWQCRLRPATEWAAEFENAGLRILWCEEDEELFASYLTQMLLISTSHGQVWPQTEIEGFRIAHHLAASRTLSYVRFVATE